MDRKGGKSSFFRTFILNEMEVIKMSFEYLDSPKLKKFQRKVTLLSAGGTFLDGYDLTIIAVAMPLILNQWEITPIMQGLLTSSAVIGSFIGAMWFGNLTDKYGRKAMYVIDGRRHSQFCLSNRAVSNWHSRQRVRIGDFRQPRRFDFRNLRFP